MLQLEFIIGSPVQRKMFVEKEKMRKQEKTECFFVHKSCYLHQPCSCYKRNLFRLLANWWHEWHDPLTNLTCWLVLSSILFYNKTHHTISWENCFLNWSYQFPNTNISFPCSLLILQSFPPRITPVNLSTDFQFSTQIGL